MIRNSTHLSWLGLATLAAASVALAGARTDDRPPPSPRPEVRPTPVDPPRPVHELLVQADLSTLTLEEATSLAVFFDAPEYFVVGHPNVIELPRADGLTWLGNRIGHPLTPGVVDQTTRGVLLNQSSGSVTFILNGVEIELSSRGMLFIGNLKHPEPGPGEPDYTRGVLMAGSCTVSNCDGINYSACCEYDGAGPGLPTCKCVRNSRIGNQCHAGGLSASGCSLTQP